MEEDQGHGVYLVALSRVPGMKGSLEVNVLYPFLRRIGVSEAQGRLREAVSEGSVEHSRDSTNRNRLEGRYGGTSTQEVKKSLFVKSHADSSSPTAGSTSCFSAAPL